MKIETKYSIGQFVKYKYLTTLETELEYGFDIITDIHIDANGISYSFANETRHIMEKDIIKVIKR